MKIENKPVFATRRYDDLAAHIIVGVKDHHRRWLMPLLIEGVVSAARPFITHSSQVCLVPVPSRKWTVRKRGEDVMLYVAKAAALRLGESHPHVRAQSLLRHNRRVSDQSTLTAAQRKTNIHMAFELRAVPPMDHALVIIDDVMTTGASITEAARVLAPWGLIGGAVATSTRL